MASRRSSTTFPTFSLSVPGATSPTGEVDLHYAGFRLRYPINSKDYIDEFCVFQGASYFRAIGKGHLYGLSARGLAIDTGQPNGEEFPFFRSFWIRTPTPDADTVVVWALLDSPSATGAYRFTIKPGDATQMDVEMTMFPRRDLEHVGHRAAHQHVSLRRDEPGGVRRLSPGRA